MAGQRMLQLRLDWGPVSLPFIRALHSQQLYGTEKELSGGSMAGLRTVRGWRVCPTLMLRLKERQPRGPWEVGANLGDCHLALHWWRWALRVVLGWPAAAAAAAKLLQSCLTLGDPIDGSPPGSSVPGILQASTLEWVAISFSNAWKWKVKGKSLSRVRPLVPHGLQPTRFLRPWDFPGKSAGVGCHCLLRGME